MGKRKKVLISAAILAVVLIFVLTGIAVYRYLAPSSTKTSPDFGLAENEIALLADGELLEEKGLVLDGESYVPADAASKYMDSRIYVDTGDKVLSYATTEGLIQANADETVYTLAKEKKEAESAILCTQNEELYVSLSFILEHTSNEIQEYEIGRAHV